MDAIISLLLLIMGFYNQNIRFIFAAALFSISYSIWGLRNVTIIHIYKHEETTKPKIQDQFYIPTKKWMNMMFFYV